MENSLEPISQNITNDFINNIAKVNRFVIPNFVGMFDFGNEGDEGIVNRS